MALEALNVHAICLDREVDRKAKLSASFEKLNIKARISGVDGRHLPSVYAKKYSIEDAKKIFGRALTNGEIAVYASHFEIWEKIAKKGSSELSLVVESDANVTHSAISVIDEIRDLDIKIDLVMLSFSSCIPSIYGKISLSNGYSLVKFARKANLATAYLLSADGAKELLNKSNSFLMPVDEFLLGGLVKKDMRIYAVYPRIIYEISGHVATSTLGYDRWALKETSEDKIRKTFATDNKPSKVRKSRVSSFFKSLRLFPWV